MEVSQNGGNQYSQLLDKPFWGSARRLVTSRATIKGAQRAIGGRRTLNIVSTP
ncbi:hypothetical protein DPMN_058686 [Dreissena polymorpha]|uniref:Uncharacterized protein n=1 Tax=Dreissena polymorpha TaxID=45954 RepID=A0A9D4HDZ8_DREPO|nr:hypothetical protein DPMN_058686 [Dreissena polymorpha]